MSRCRLPRGCIIRAPKALECSSIAGRPFLRATCAWASCQHPVKSDLSCVNVNPRGPRSCRLLFLESRSTFRCSRAGRLISPEPASDFFNSERPGTWEKSRTEEVWGEFCLCRASGGLQPLISPSDFQRQTTYSLLVSMCLIQVSSRVQNRSVYRGTELFSDVDDVSFRASAELHGIALRACRRKLEFDIFYCSRSPKQQLAPINVHLLTRRYKLQCLRQRLRFAKGPRMFRVALSAASSSEPPRPLRRKG